MDDGKEKIIFSGTFFRLPPLLLVKDNIYIQIQNWETCAYENFCLFFRCVSFPVAVCSRRTQSVGRPVPAEW